MRGCDCPPDDCAAKVRSYLAGDRGAGDDLVRKFTPLVQAIARRVLGPDSQDDRDDACQVAFLKIFARLETWEGRCPFCDWLAVVATRRILDQAQQVRSNLPTVGLPREVVDPRPQPLPPEVVECLERIVARLPPEWKRAYELAVKGEDRQGIARALGKSVRTIQYWLAAIREEMEDCLEG
jgi:RNA polymerase sigma factor (sigma-70 family)